MSVRFFCALLIFGSTRLAGQHVLSLPGKTVEVIGLKRWTIAMIQDSMAKYAPGEDLSSHACAAVLRYKLGFADASATTYVGMDRDSVQRIVVAVVEPQDSARTRHRVMPMDTAALYQSWSAALRIADSLPFVAFEAARTRTRTRGAGPSQVPDGLGRHVTAFQRYDAFLASHRTEADYRTALRIATRDSNYVNRLVAASILGTFTERDSAIYALLDAAMESDGPVKSMALTVLQSFGNHAPRTVNWRPKSAALHGLLNGTVSGLPVIMTLLAQTGADRTLARDLLFNGGESVLDFLGAQHWGPRDSAHRFLVAVAGRDLGTDPGPWREWIRGL